MAVLTRRRDQLGVAVRNARIARGMKQRDLAESIGVYVGTISNVERGLVNTEPETVRKLEEALGLDLSAERLYREGTVTLAVEAVQRRFASIEPAQQVPFLTQVIGFITAWTPPLRAHNGDSPAEGLARMQYEQRLRAIPGISETQVMAAMMAYDSSGL